MFELSSTVDEFPVGKAEVIVIYVYSFIHYCYGYETIVWI